MKYDNFYFQDEYDIKEIERKLYSKPKVKENKDKEVVALYMKAQKYFSKSSN